MPSNIEAPAALAQVNAAALPLPDSRPGTPAAGVLDAEIAKSSSKAAGDELGQPDPHRAVLVEVSANEDNKSTGSVSGDASVKSESDESACVKTVGASLVSGCHSATVDKIETTQAKENVPRCPIESSNDGIDNTTTETQTSPVSEPNAASKTSSVAVDGCSVTPGTTDLDGDESPESIDTRCTFGGPNSTMYTVLTCPSDVDQFDKDNNGDVVKFYFTKEICNRSLSPVQEQGLIELQLTDDSNLFIETTGTNGPLYAFEVDSEVLAIGSPVFYDMAYKTHTRGNKEKWVWKLDDSPVGLKVLFSILHLNMPAPLLAQEPKSEQVYDTLRVLEKYKLKNSAFYPWAKVWVAGFRKSLANTVLNPLECLYVAYKLGDFKSLKRFIRMVAHEAQIGDDGELDLGNDKLPQGIVPITDDVMDAIRAVRTADLQVILRTLNDSYDFLINPENLSQRRFCVSVSHHRECNQKLLGSLVTGLVSQSLYPIPKPENFRGRVGDLARTILAMDMRGLYFPGLAPHEQRHGLCKLGLEDVAKEMLKCAAYLPLPAVLLKHMYDTGRHIGIHQAEKPEFRDYKAVYNLFGALYRKEFSKQIWAWEDGGDVKDDASVFSEDDSGIIDGNPRSNTQAME